MGKRVSLKAADVHKDWKRAVSEARDSVRVFTPYFDRLLPPIVADAVNRDLTVVVVTDLSPTGGQDYPAQLRAAKRLLDLGVTLRTLPRLHAKVLQADRTRIVLGSQNFTTFARASREASVVGPSVSGEKVFLAQLDKWASMAEPVDRELLSLLAAKLVKPHQLLVEQEEKVRTEFEEILEVVRLQRLAASLPVRLRKAASASKASLGDGPAIGEVTKVGDFRTFFVTNGSDLTKWRVSEGITRLPWLMQIPIVREDTGQMGFARVAKTRISYINNSVVRKHSNLSILGSRFSVTILFPSDDCSNRNIRATFAIGSTPIAIADFLFTGEDLVFVDARLDARRPSTPGPLAYVEAIRTHFSDSDKRAQFFATNLSPFVYSVLGRDSPNAESYFGRASYRLRPIWFADTPVLLATPICV